MNESQMEAEDIARDAAEKRGALMDERISDYESVVWYTAGDMFEIFSELPHREGFIEEYCTLTRLGKWSSADAYIFKCLREEVHDYAVRNCKESD